MDDVDLALLRLLQENPRASYTSMATSVSLSPAAVRNRVTRLFSEELVRGIVVVDPMLRGIQAAALVGIRHRGALGSLVDSVQSRPEIMWAAVTSGRYDLMVELGCRDNEHMLEIVNELRELDLVEEVEVINVLKYVKFDQQKIQVRPRPTN